MDHFLQSMNLVYRMCQRTLEDLKLFLFVFVVLILIFNQAINCVKRRYFGDDIDDSEFNEYELLHFLETLSNRSSSQNGYSTLTNPTAAAPTTTTTSTVTPAALNLEEKASKLVRQFIGYFNEALNNNKNVQTDDGPQQQQQSQQPQSTAMDTSLAATQSPKLETIIEHPEDNF